MRPPQAVACIAVGAQPLFLACHEHDFVLPAGQADPPGASAAPGHPAALAAVGAAAQGTARRRAV
ncbi:hypothetical protein CBM2626_B130224 [Cupriavidus taiwanensis]|nr:hypothetical protein CBM2626_B130224 [Cupriavidus taiwanensis]